MAGKTCNLKSKKNSAAFYCGCRERRGGRACGALPVYYYGSFEYSQASALSCTWNSKKIELREPRMHDHLSILHFPR